MSSNPSAAPIRAVLQFSTNLNYGDAISDEVLVIDRALKQWGYDTAVYCQHIMPRMRDRARPFHDFKPPHRPWLSIYHHSIASDLCTFASGLDGPKIMIYHNVTPPEYFYGTNYFMGELTRKGRADLASLAPRYALGLGDSDFNRQDLAAAGFRRTGVLPLIIDYDKYRTPPNPAVVRRLGDGRTNVLFVGRISPNKRQEDVIKAFAYYKQLDATARLILAGSDETTEAYRRWLDDLVRTLNVPDVIFAGRIDLRDLVAYYQTASVLLNMSEHEGFGVPLVESMHFGVPIVAFASSAIPETLGGCGVLIHRKDYATIAAAVYEVTHDEALRRRLAARGRERLRDFDPPRLLDQLRGHLRELEA
jgi:glycosyltransferase involved in cell wall biosynthesis